MHDFPITKRIVCGSVVLVPLLVGGCFDNTGDSNFEAAPVATITLSNPSEFERIDEATVLELDALGVVPGTWVGLAVEDGSARLPSQLLDTDGDGTRDSLLFVADYARAEVKELNVSVTGDEVTTLVKRTQAEVSRKEGGEWEGEVYKGGEFVNVEEVVPPSQYTDHSEYIRYEGPGIESDKVGYRVYLDWRNGFDIFGKKTNEMVLQAVGLDSYNSYHEAADWGMDILKVGDAVGVGGYGYWDGEKIIRVSDTQERSTRVVNNGALQSSLEISYNAWQAGEQQTDMTALLSMTAGSRFVNVRLSAAPEFPNIAIGLVKHPDAEFIEGDLEISGHAWTYVATWGKQALSGDNLGTFLLIKKNTRRKQTEDEHNFVSVMRLGNGRLEYYFGAAWSQEPDGIQTKEDFVAYLEKAVERLTMPLRSRIKTAATIAETDKPVDAAKALEWSVRLAESEIQRMGDSLSHGGFDTDGNRDARWSYTTGLFAQALDDLTAVTGDSKFAAHGKATLDSYLAGDGSIHTYKPEEFNIDHVNSGKMLLRYFERLGDEKYLEAAHTIRGQLKEHPRTSEGAFWHKQRYPWQLWLDGVYMGMPFLAHYSLLTNDDSGLEEAINEFLIADRQLRDASTGLYFHAWDENKEQIWADSETGLSKFFWSRGMGWFAMALVDVLDFVPEERTDLRDPVIEMIRSMADTLIAYRSSEGLWYQITDQPGATGNYLEASGSSMFVYMLAKAVNKGYLDDRYANIAVESFAALASEFINVRASGRVTLMNICQVAGLGYGRDGSYRYYMSEPVVSNDPKGTAPFIMAGIEINGMLDH